MQKAEWAVWSIGMGPCSAWLSTPSSAPGNKTEHRDEGVTQSSSEVKRKQLNSTTTAVAAAAAHNNYLQASKCCCASHAQSYLNNTSGDIPCTMPWPDTLRARSEMAAAAGSQAMPGQSQQPAPPPTPPPQRWRPAGRGPTDEASCQPHCPVDSLRCELRTSASRWHSDCGR